MSLSPQNNNYNVSHSLSIISADPIKVVDEESAKNRVKQWALQREQIEKIGHAFKAFKFYHRMSLMDVYEDIHKIAMVKFPNQRDKQRVFERNIICAQEEITERTERRLKTSAERLKYVTNLGINFNQIIKIGMHVSDFETASHFYNKFMDGLDPKLIEERIADQVQPVNTKALLDKLSATYQTELED